MPRDDLPLSALVLAIASGTGEHSVGFSGALPALTKTLMAAARCDPARMKAKGQSVAFKLSKQRLAERDALVISLREKAAALNVAIAVFNHAIEPISRPVIEARDDYNAILEKARTLSGGVTEAAHEEFDARSERWQQSDKGIQVRSWIEQWELNLDDIDLEMPEPLTEIDPDERALEIEDAPPNPTE